jgi:hypothetical protein
MRKNQFLKILAPGLALALAPMACGEDDTGSTNGATTTGSGTSTTGTTAPGGSGTVGGTTAVTPAGGATDTTGGTTTTGGDTTTPEMAGTSTSQSTTTDGTTDTADAVPDGPTAMCDEAPTSGGASNTLPAFDGVQRIFLYGDGQTTLCVDDMQAGQLCAQGTGSPSNGPDGDYQYWGAGFGLQVADTDDATGDLVAPFDATAAGIAGVKFTITGATGGAPIRMQLGMVNDPAITTPSANYEENGFAWGGGSSNDITADDDITIMLEEFSFPEWTEFEGGADTPLDVTKLHSLQFQIVTEPDAAHNYNFCISNFQWIDAAGNAVDAPEPTPAEGGGSPDEGAGGAGGAPGDDTMDTMDGMGGMDGMDVTDDMVTDDMVTDDMVTDDMADMGMGGMGGTDDMMDMGGDVTFDQVHAILVANCAGNGCHGEGADMGAMAKPEFANPDAATSQGYVDAEIDDIITRITSTDTDPMAFGTRRMPPSDVSPDGLSAEDIATIQAYADTL